MKSMMLLPLSALVLALAGCSSYRGSSVPLDDVNYDRYGSRPAVTNSFDSNPPRREFPSDADPVEQPH